ncbi:hypothetical protein LCGC14_2115280, partial [marine sediment metagenome]
FKVAIKEEGTESLAELRGLLRTMNEPKGRVENFGKDFGGGVRQWYGELARQIADRPEGIAYAAAIRQAIRELLEYRQFEAHGRYWKDLR